MDGTWNDRKDIMKEGTHSVLDRIMDRAVEDMARDSIEVLSVYRMSSVEYGWGKAEVSVPSLEGQDDIRITADWYSSSGWDCPQAARRIYLNVERGNGSRRGTFDPYDSTELKAEMNLVDSIKDFIRSHR